MLTANGFANPVLFLKDESSPVTNEGSQHQLFGGLLVVYTF
jgi:hypothetical protein